MMEDSSLNGNDSFIVAFKKTRKKLHAYIENRIKEYQLTSNQVDVLIFLLRNRQYNTAKDIVDFIGVSKGLVSRSIDGLIKRNFVSVQADDKDRRKLRLFITEAGNEIVNKIDKFEREFMNKISVSITNDELRALESITNKILRNLQTVN